MLYSIECECAGQPLNPGQSGCVPKVGRDKFPIYMHTRDSTGAINTIANGDVLDQAAVTAKLNHIDLTKRWYVFPEMWNVQYPMPEDEKEEIDGVPFKTGDEIKTLYTYEHVDKDANPALIAVYDSFDCIDVSVMYVTNKGQLNGMSDGSGGLTGIRQQTGTVSAKYAPPSVGVVQKITVTGLVNDNEYDANRDYIDSASIAYSAKSWFAIQPLEVIQAHVSDATQTTIVVTLDLLRGQAFRKAPAIGFVAADWSYDNGTTTATVYNQTDAASVVVTAAESATIPGQYTLTMASVQTASDVILIDIFKSGYQARQLSVTLG